MPGILKSYAVRCLAGRVYSLAGRTRVRELAAVIQKLDLLISVDSGPCHMAAALGTPLVVLWGPRQAGADPSGVDAGPASASSATPVPCAPCQSTPLQKSCRRNLCMECISPEECCSR